MRYAGHWMMTKDEEIGVKGSRVLDWSLGITQS